jgi:hypothetical protein
LIRVHALLAAFSGIHLTPRALLITVFFLADAHPCHKIVQTNGKIRRSSSNGAIRLFHNLRAMQLFPRTRAERFNCRHSIFPRNSDGFAASGVNERIHLT